MSDNVDLEFIEDALKRAEQFSLFELPGQPMMAHMGTNYLINDLVKIAKQCREFIDTPKDPA